MEQKIIDRFQEIKGDLHKEFLRCRPYDYHAVFKELIKHLYCNDLPFERNQTAMISTYAYSGDNLFVVPMGKWPEEFWYAKLAYGSCSGCDTFERIISRLDQNTPPDKQEADDMVMLALHMAEEMKLL